MRTALTSAAFVLTTALGAVACGTTPMQSGAGTSTTSGAVHTSATDSSVSGSGTDGTQGNGTTSGTGTKTSGGPDLSAFSTCMRANGVADFPDPSADGGIELPDDIDRNGATFQAAEAACHADLPVDGASPVSGPASSTSAGSIWQRVTPGGDCGCADGSAFSFEVRAANPSKVLLYFQSGGACFTAALCKPDRGVYHPSVGQSPPEAQGIFDFSNAANPFADYTIVYVPYCTGDTFLGSATVDYATDETIHHSGFADGSAALDYIGTHYLDATDVVVAGESAGSVAAPLYGGLAAARFSIAAVTVIADSSGFYPDQPSIDSELATAWNVDPAIAALTGGTAGAADFSIPGLFVLSGHRHPGVRFARFDYAADAQQARWKDLADIELVEPAVNEAAIERAGVALASYTAPGDDHVVLSTHSFYTVKVGDVRLVDWVTDLIDHRTVADVG